MRRVRLGQGLGQGAGLPAERRLGAVSDREGRTVRRAARARLSVLVGRLERGRHPVSFAFHLAHWSLESTRCDFSDSAPAVRPAHTETKAAYPETKVAYTHAKTEYAAAEPAVVKVEVAADAAPVAPVAPAPEPVRVIVPQPVQVQETVQLIQAPAPLPIPVVRAPIPVQFAPAPLQFAPAPVQFGQQFAPQIFRVNAPPRQGTVVDQQFLEDLQNQSVDADEDGQPGI